MSWQVRKRSEMTRSAKSGIAHLSKRSYSNTSSARASNVGASSSPRALAVFWLIRNSNFVGCSTGRFAGSCGGTGLVAVPKHPLLIICVQQKRYPRHAWKRFLEDRKPFGTKFDRDMRQSRDVAARSSQTVDQLSPNGIRHDDEYSRYCRCCPLCCQSRKWSYCNQYIDVERC